LLALIVITLLIMLLEFVTFKATLVPNR
jgi:hypothetical protein